MSDEATQNQLDGLKRQFPRGAVFGLGEYQFFIRPPSRDEYRRFQQGAASPESRGQALEALALNAIVYPPKETLNSILDEYPAFTPKLGNAALELAGSELEVSKKG